MMATFTPEATKARGLSKEYNKYIGGSTDANEYTANATSVDFTLENGLPAEQTHNRRVDYTLSLERQSGKSWISEVITSGYFESNVTKSLSLSGVPAGNYCVVAYLQNSGNNYANVTSLFKVH